MASNPEGSRSFPLLATAVALGVLARVLLGALVGVVGFVWLRPGGSRPVLANTPTVVREVQGLNQLVSVKYVLEKIVILEDVKWYGGNRLLLVAHGVAKAGVDLSKLLPKDIDAAGDVIRVRLPKAQLFDVYLDDRRTQVVERSTGLLREFDKDLEQDARRMAVDQIRVAARESGILRDAEERARLQLAELFRRLGFKSVAIEFR